MAWILNCNVLKFNKIKGPTTQMSHQPFTMVFN